MDIHFIAFHVLQPQWPSSLEWKEGKNIMPFDRLHWPYSVLINGNMWFEGNDQVTDIVNPRCACAASVTYLLCVCVCVCVCVSACLCVFLSPLIRGVARISGRGCLCASAYVSGWGRFCLPHSHTQSTAG